MAGVDGVGVLGVFGIFGVPGVLGTSGAGVTGVLGVLGVDPGIALALESGAGVPGTGVLGAGMLGSGVGAGVAAGVLGVFDGNEPPIELLGVDRPFEPKPMFIAVNTAAGVDEDALYLLEQFLRALRVVASMRPDTWEIPQPSSRSCCCSAITSTRESDCAANGVAAQQQTTRVVMVRTFMVPPKGGKTRRRRTPLPAATSGPRTSRPTHQTRATPRPRRSSPSGSALPAGDTTAGSAGRYHPEAHP